MNSNDIEYHLLQAMNAYYVPVAGFAVIDDYKISNVNTLSIDHTIPVTLNSLSKVHQSVKCSLL